MFPVQSSLLVLSALLCFTWGWEPDTQYEYMYSGRSAVGIYKLKEQNAVVQLESYIIVQSVDQNTLIVKLKTGHVRHTGNFKKCIFKNKLDPYNGDEDELVNPKILPEVLSAPFVISHNKGSITGVRIGSEEPEWIVNFKKSIASQLQTDITGVRRDGPAVSNWPEPKDGESATFTTYEDSITGDCKTSVAISRLPMAQVYSHEAFELSSFETVCGDKPVYEIVKSRDFDSCMSNPAWHSTSSSVYSTCDSGKANCGDFLKRNSVSKYLACGHSLAELTFIYGKTQSKLLVQPLATKNDELINTVAADWTLERKEKISSHLAVSSRSTEHKSLSYVFDDYTQLKEDGTPAQPNLFDAYFKSVAPVSELRTQIEETLVELASDIKENPSSKKDKIDRLAVISRVLSMFSLSDLKILWENIKSQDPKLASTLLIDCIVQSGSNPAVMLIKELVETEEITGSRATWALAALGFYAKTPTRELLHELLNLIKSSPVQSSKTLMQTTLMTVADLLSNACRSRPASASKFLGDLCDSKDSIITEEFLPLLTKELESSQSGADRIVVLSALGSLAVKEIIPVLLPVIRGTPGRFDDTAERVSAIFSLHLVALVAPEKVHPTLFSLTNNRGERPEIRMSAAGILLITNAALPVWQKIASSTWFEPSQQVQSFVHSIIHSLSKIPTSIPFYEDLNQKAGLVLPLVKPAPFGVPYSFGDIRSTYLPEEGIAVMMSTINIRVADQHWPVYLANSYHYQLGPLSSPVLSVYFWNYNMSDVWQNMLVLPCEMLRSMQRAGISRESNLKSIWEELKVTAKPTDKRAGLLHINLMGSMNRFINLEKLEEMYSTAMEDAAKERNKPIEVSVTKYRMLAEYNIHLPNELGLPMSYLATLPIFASMQGQINSDGKGGIQFDIATEYSWKLTGQLRVEIPFTGHYIATGVDNRVEIRPPRDLTFSYEAPGKLKVTWTPGNKITDLIYYHVRPYTVARSTTQSLRPALEDPAGHVISVTDTPIQREIPLGARFGVNLKLVEESEVAYSDQLSWYNWFKKWDVNGWSNLGFVPFDVRSRMYALRYDPSGSKAQSVSTYIQYQFATKSSEDTIVYESGSSSARKPSQPEVVSSSPIVTEFRPFLDRLFKDLESGNAHLMRAGIDAKQQDGSVINLAATLGLSKDAWYTKDFTDFKMERSITTGSDKKVDYAVCYWAVRRWNKPSSTQVSSDDILRLTDEEEISFGEKCDQSKITFKAKVYRDQEAANIAINSPAGKQCEKDMNSGFMYGSPACTRTRRHDFYNNYEMTAEAKDLEEPLASWLNGIRRWTNKMLYPFTVKHVQGQSNHANRAIWNVRRDPITGASNMTFVRPMETLVATNVRFSDQYVPFSPLALAYSKIFYPLSASGNFIRNAANLTSGGVSESRCYVGPYAVYTFDGAFYNYTMDGCHHVLMTDCQKKSEIAITARHDYNGHKIVTVIYGQDTVEIDPSGFVSVNGDKTEYKNLPKESRIEIRDQTSKSIKVIVYPLTKGVKLEIRSSMSMFVKAVGSQVEISAPEALRGRSCGLCGDYNQEITGEWKTAERCSVSSGDLMAASFKLKSGEDCSTPDSDEIERRLQKETGTCHSVDQQFHTNLPDYTL